MPLIHAELSNEVLRTLADGLLAEHLVPGPGRRFTDLHVERIQFADADFPGWEPGLEILTASAATLAAVDPKAPQWLTRDQVAFHSRRDDGAFTPTIFEVAPLFAVVRIRLRQWTAAQAGQVPFDSDTIAPTVYDGLAFRLSATLSMVGTTVRANLHASFAGVAIGGDGGPPVLVQPVGELGDLVPPEVLEIIGDIEKSFDLPAGLVPSSIDFGAGDDAPPRMIGHAVAAPAPGGGVLRIGLDPFIGPDVAHWRDFCATASRKSTRAPFDELVAWIDRTRAAAIVRDMVQARLDEKLDVRASVGATADEITIRCTLHANQLLDQELGEVEAKIRYALSRALVITRIGEATMNTTRAEVSACICAEVSAHAGNSAALAIFLGGAPFVDALGSFATVSALLAGLEDLADDAVDDILADAIAEHCPTGDADCRQIAVPVPPFAIGSFAALSLRRIEPEGEGIVVGLAISTFASDATISARVLDANWRPEIIKCKGAGSAMNAWLALDNTGERPVTIGAFEDLGVGNPPIMDVRAASGGGSWVGPRTVPPGRKLPFEVRAAVATTGYDSSRPLWLRVLASHRVWDHDLNEPDPAVVLSPEGRTAFDRAEQLRCRLPLGVRAPWRSPHTDPVRFRPRDVVWESIAVRIAALDEPAVAWLDDAEGRLVTSIAVSGAARELRATVLRPAAAEHRNPSMSIGARWTNSATTGSVPVGAPTRSLYLRTAARRLAAPARATAVRGGEVAILAGSQLELFASTHSGLRRIAVRDASSFATVIAVDDHWVAVGSDHVAVLDACGCAVHTHRLARPARVLGVTDGALFLTCGCEVLELRVDRCGLEVQRHAFAAVDAFHVGAHEVWLRAGQVWRRGPRRRATGSIVDAVRAFGEVLDVGDLGIRTPTNAATLEVFERFETWPTGVGTPVQGKLESGCGC